MTHNPTVLTREALAEIRARADAATEGPWAIVEYGDGDSLVIHSSDENRVCFMATHGGSRKSWDAIQANAELITHARTDIPRLLDALESLPPVEPTEAMVDAAARDMWKEAGCEAHSGFDNPKFGDGGPNAFRRMARAALKAALALAKPQEHNGSEGNG